MAKLKLIILLLCVCIQNTYAQIDYPILTEFVTDQAAIFSDSQVIELSQKLKAYETETTHQIVVLTINDLLGETIEAYALQVFNKNKIGQEKKDNGLLLLFSKNDRKVRLEVGYGLEPIITDAISSRIIRDIMIPEFKEEDYYEGIKSGTSKIIEIINNPAYAEEFATTEEESNSIPLLGKIFIGLFVATFLGVFVFLGFMFFSGAYEQLVNLYRGLIIGKVGVFSFPFILISCVFPILVSLPFILMPIVFFLIIASLLFFDSDPEYFLNSLFSSSYFNLNNVIIFAIIFLVIVPLIMAFLKKSYRKPEPFKLSLKNDKKYISKHITSFGSSSSSSRSSSSSSWSSSSSGGYSGGGGSSGGGGASGSW